ncbi:MAG: hypothetical protein Q8M54_05845 [Desulfobaccales bacterium]|nr:hypothetical protein [Desulfobaccales bacterium]
MAISLNIMPPPHMPPPTLSFRSKMATLCPFWASRQAVVSPAGPPPTTATSRSRLSNNFSVYLSIIALVMRISSSAMKSPSL